MKWKKKVLGKGVFSQNYSALPEKSSEAMNKIKELKKQLAKLLLKETKDKN